MVSSRSRPSKSLSASSALALALDPYSCRRDIAARRAVPRTSCRSSCASRSAIFCAQVKVRHSVSRPFSPDFLKHDPQASQEIHAAARPDQMSVEFPQSQSTAGDCLLQQWSVAAVRGVARMHLVQLLDLGVFRAQLARSQAGQLLQILLERIQPCLQLQLSCAGSLQSAAMTNLTSQWELRRVPVRLRHQTQAGTFHCWELAMLKLALQQSIQEPQAAIRPGSRTAGCASP